MDVQWKQGSYYAAADKAVHVSIYNGDSHFLDDQFPIGTARAVETSATWRDFSTATVELYEVGDPDEPGDSYNQQLVASGPRLLKTAVYRYNAVTREFSRVSLVP